jgi:tetratricopeptide (TPR) repeat protein
MKDYVKGVEMLDSAVGCFRQGARDAAPYILTRALVKVSAGKFRDAVVDFNSYEQLAGGMLSAEFYYMREQAELNARMYQQALNDIETAIDLAPGNLLYYIEKGMLCYRVKLTDEGLRTMEKAAGMAPDLADIHYLIGRLHMQKGDRESALASLEKAHSLGHPDAEVQINSLGN